MASLRLADVYARITRTIEEGEIDAAALAAAQRGEQIADWHAGMAAPGMPAGPTTLWQLASISKSYTAALVMALVERGALTLSTRAAEMLPGFGGGAKDAITLRHLLTHTSGLIYESPQMEQRLVDRTPLDGLIDEAYDSELMYEPGTGFSYSDYGYGLAGRMAAVAMGEPFPELVRRYVLEPAGLGDTHMSTPVAHQARTAHVKGCLAEGTSGAMYNSEYGRSVGHPSFGVAASASDLMRFGLLFAPGSATHIHSRATVRVMSTDQTGGLAPGKHPGDASPGKARSMAWGYGFYQQGPSAPDGFGDLAPPGTFGHWGASGCALMIDPVDEIVVAYVSNRHARAGQVAWVRRITVVLNGVLAALT